MDEKQKQIEELKQKIQVAEEDINAAKRALFELTGEGAPGGAKVSSINNVDTTNGEIIEGEFNGENMVGLEGKVYPVPANYASKSKLVEGDKLKLTIAEDGTFVFKQISPVEREKVVAELCFSNNAYHATYNNNDYNILYASVTYHKAKPGDRVAIVIPKGGNSNWAVLENVLHDGETIESNKESKIDPEPLKQKEETVTEKVIEPITDTLQENQDNQVVPDVQLDEPQPADAKPDVLGVSDIQIETPKAPVIAESLQDEVKPEIVQQPQTQKQQQSAPQIHPLEATETVEQPEQPVKELDI